MRSIEVNVLSTKSINAALKELREYRKEIENFLIDEFMDEVARDISDIIIERIGYTYNSGKNLDANIHPDVISVGHNRIIKANGKQIAFLEFGAGAEASPGIYPTVGNVTADFTPGSWSEDHARTYQAWEAGGYVGMYRYEQAPAHAFDTAIAELPYIVRKRAKEVFDD